MPDSALHEIIAHARALLDEDGPRDAQCAMAARPAPMTDHDLVEHNMTNHPPEGPWVTDRFEKLRRLAKVFAHEIVDLCPPCPEKGRALEQAELALSSAVAAIARNQR